MLLPLQIFFALFQVFFKVDFFFLKSLGGVCRRLRSGPKAGLDERRRFLPTYFLFYF